METLEGGIFFEREVWVALDEKVVVAPVDEEDGFGAVGGVVGAVKEVALTVRLFADVVATELC